MKTKLLTAAIISAMSCSSFAEEAKTGMEGSGKAGYSANTGNTEDQSLFASLKLAYTQKMYKLSALIEANQKSEKNITTKERYVGDFKGNLYFSSYPKTYGFGQIRYENDRFENIDLNSYYLAGLGHEYFKTDAKLLTLEAGLGYQKEDYTPNSSDADFDQMIGKLALDYEMDLNDNVRFLQDANVFSGSTQTKLETNTGIKVKMTQALNLGVSFKYRHNTNPAAGKVKDDTLTMLTLGYDF